MIKRGIEHIEMIFAFILFAAAVFFAFYFFNPANSSRLVDSSMEYSFQEIIKNSSTELMTFTVKTSPPEGVDRLAINFSSVPIAMNPSVEDLQGNSVESTKYNDLIYLTVIPSTEQLFTVRFSPDIINLASLSPGVLNENFYKIASEDSEKIISEQRILALKDDYNANYQELRKRFNLPSRVNFGFSLEFSKDENITAEKSILSQDIKSDRRQVKVLRLNNKVVSADLLVKIW